MLTPERWQRVKLLFEAASQLSASERGAYVHEQSGADEELAREVESLLREREVMGDFLEPRVGTGSVEPDDWRAGESVSGFTLLSELGRGGMGVVWLAEQRHPHRTVALKLLQPAALGRDGARRFLREADLLARLAHPNIAQVFESGSAEKNGVRRPWFALELVPGVPIDEHARSLSLDVRARIALFVKVCDAVQHAHERGIVHRDLKPANVLVSAAGEPKVLDFGIARAHGLDGEVASLHTRAGMLLGTLDYMSPEQLAGDPEAVDGRADVYALGVVLHELLVGRRPHEVSDRPLPEALRALQEQEAAPLSRWDRRLRGDLETIVAKALEKERARRYASAAELAADLRSFQDERPISARPASTIYHLRKFARRNTALVAGVCATFVVLLAGATTSTLLYLRESRAREAMGVAKTRAEDAEKRLALSLDKTTDALKAEELARKSAERQAERADRTKQFLLHLYDSIDPMNTSGQNITVRAVIDAEARRLEHALDDEPEVKAELLETLALVYRGLGAFDRSRELFTQCIELRARPPVADELLLASAYEMRASVAISSLDQFEAALADCERAIAIFHEHLGEGSSRTVQARGMHAALVVKRRAGGDWPAMAAAAVPMLLLLDPSTLPDDMRELSKTLRALDEDDKAGRSAALWTFYADSTEELARLWRTGERAQAAAEIRAHAAPLLASAYWRRMTPVVIGSVGAWMDAHGEDPDAIEPLLREAVAIADELKNAFNRARAHNQLADFLRDRGRRAEARASYERALELHRQSKGEQHADVASCLFEMAELELADGERHLAEEHARAAAWVWRTSKSATDPLVVAADQLVAKCAESGP